MDEMDEVSDMQEYAKERWKKRQKRYRKVSIPVEKAWIVLGIWRILQNFYYFCIL